MLRAQVNYILTTYANNDIKNLTTILIDNHSPITVADCFIPGKKGIKYIDQDIGGGVYLTGFLIYGLMAYTQRQHPEETHEYFLPAEEIKGIGWKTTVVPDYVPTEEA